VNWKLKPLSLRPLSRTHR